MEFDIKYYLLLFLRRLHYFLLIFMLVSGAGVVVAYTLQPVYRAEALLLVESAQIPGDLAASTVRTAAPEQLSIITQRLMTRANLLDVAERFDIYDNRDELSPDEIVENMRDRTTIGLPNPRDAATFVSVSFDAPTGELSAQVTNEFVTLILQENVELRTATAGQTLDFFQQEVERLTSELAEQGARISAFKQANEGALPDSLDYRRGRQAAQQERLLQLERDLDRLRDRRARLVELYERTGRVEPMAENLTPEQRKLQELESELAVALTIYAPQNPRIKVLQGQVQAQRRLVSAQTGLNDDGEALSAYELQLADIDGQIEYTLEQADLIRKELEELEASLEATPQNAVELDVLERDYENIKMQYALASDRLAQAVTGDRIEALSKGQRIAVIEQAIVPNEPSSPNRPLIAAGGGVAGLGLGFGIVLLIELLNRSIRRPAELGAKLGIAPFATIPYIPTRGEQARRRFKLVFAFLFVLVGVPAGLYAIHHYYLPMDLLVERVLDRTGLSPVLDQIRSGIAE